MLLPNGKNIDPKSLLLISLLFVATFYLVILFRAIICDRRKGSRQAPTALGTGIGIVTNFFDALGIGSYATTTALFRLLKIVPDEKIPGTLNIGHTLSAISQTFIFVKAIPVESATLIPMIIAAILGSWLGASVVSGMSRMKIRYGMGLSMLVASVLLLLPLVGITARGSDALGAWGLKLGIALVGNFVLGALMTLGIGLYAPCLIMVGLLGMNVRSAFPIMMGSCAFLMPLASVKFIQTRQYDTRAALGLALGSVPGVLAAAYIVKSLPLTVLRWVVFFVVSYTGITLVAAANKEKSEKRNKAGNTGVQRLSI